MKQSIGIPSDKIMHTAVTTRDARYDEVFVFGVVTTGIFCKPSCPSRAANPENIRFFRDTAAAMLAGFRACKRCQAPENAFYYGRFVRVATSENI